MAMSCPSIRYICTFVSSGRVNRNVRTWWYEPYSAGACLGRSVVYGIFDGYSTLSMQI
jgi:hypothetical protein